MLLREIQSTPLRCTVLRDNINRVGIEEIEIELKFYMRIKSAEESSFNNKSWGLTLTVTISLQFKQAARTLSKVSAQH